MTSHRPGLRFTVDQLEWLQRKAAEHARDTEGTKEGQRWKHLHDWAWFELMHRRTDGDLDAQPNGEVKP
jgi:hypothetical protein